MRIQFILLILILILSSCSSTIHYISNDKVPVYLNRERTYNVEFELEEELRFYIFGYYPASRTVALDELAMRSGMIAISKLRIEEYQTPWHTILSVLSLGLYMPRKVLVHGWGKQ